MNRPAEASEAEAFGASRDRLGAVVGYLAGPDVFGCEHAELEDGRASRWWHRYLSRGAEMSAASGLRGAKRLARAYRAPRAAEDSPEYRASVDRGDEVAAEQVLVDALRRADVSRAAAQAALAGVDRHPVPLTDEIAETLAVSDPGSAVDSDDRIDDLDRQLIGRRATGELLVWVDAVATPREAATWIRVTDARALVHHTYLQVLGPDPDADLLEETGVSYFAGWVPTELSGHTARGQGPASSSPGRWEPTTPGSAASASCPRSSPITRSCPAG